MKTTSCTWKGCKAITSERPAPAGWTYLSDWGPGIKDGRYCPAHAAALEALLLDGGLDDPEDEDDVT